MTPTKKEFLEVYRKNLRESNYPWTRDEDRLNKFMESVKETITTKANKWNKEGAEAMIAWRKIGGKGALTYKALRALPE